VIAARCELCAQQLALKRYLRGDEVRRIAAEQRIAAGLRMETIDEWPY
jgi:hypothetical protein